MVVLINERLLVVAVGLVASGEFDQMVNIFRAVVISLDDDLVGSGTLNNTGMLCNNADTRVNRRLALDTGTYCRSLGS